MLRKERKWNHIKRSVKTTMARKKGRRVQDPEPSEGRGEKYTMKGNGT